MEDAPDKRRWIADAVAGASVAFIAIPQGLAYAEIAGMPAYTGLYATAVPAVLAGFTSDSRYLQTGPVATTSLLTFGALVSLGAAAKSEEYIALAALLALLVGLVRLLLGFLKMGGISDLMSRPIILGFTSAAAILIAGSQSDKAFGVEGAPGGLLQKLFFVLAHPGEWNWAAIGLSMLTAALVIGGKRIHNAFPGVMLAVVVGVVIGRMDSYPASLVGTVPSGLPNFSFSFMWSAIPSLLIPAIVIYLGIGLVPDLPDAFDAPIRIGLWVYMTFMVVFTLSALLSAGNKLYELQPNSNQRPIKGFVQLLQIIIFMVGAIFIVSIVLDKSLTILLSGLGAMTAVTMLVFKDTIVSLVASIQLTTQDMVRVGDLGIGKFS